MKSLQPPSLIGRNGWVIVAGGVVLAVVYTTIPNWATHKRPSARKDRMMRIVWGEAIQIVTRDGCVGACDCNQWVGRVNDCAGEGRCGGRLVGWWVLSWSVFFSTSAFVPNLGVSHITPADKSQFNFRSHTLKKCQHFTPPSDTYYLNFYTAPPHTSSSTPTSLT